MVEGLGGCHCPASGTLIAGFGGLRFKEWIARRAATENRMAVRRGVEWFVPLHLKSLLIMEGLL